MTATIPAFETAYALVIYVCDSDEKIPTHIRKSHSFEDGTTNLPSIKSKLSIK